MKMYAYALAIWCLIVLAGWHERGWIDWLGGLVTLGLILIIAKVVKSIGI